MVKQESPAQLHMPREIAQDVHSFIEQLKREFADELLSVVAFGATVSGEYVHWKDDVDLLILLKSAQAPTLDKAARVASPWLKRFPLDPIIMTPKDLKRAREVIPAELLNMHHRHQLLFGADPMEEIEIDGNTLALELEHSFERKLARLRSHYLRVANDERGLTELITEGIDRFIDLLTCLMFLHGKTPPTRLRELCTQIKFEFDIDGATLHTIAQVKLGKVTLRRGEAAEIFQKFLHIVEQMVEVVEQIKGTGT